MGLGFGLGLGLELGVGVGVGVRVRAEVRVTWQRGARRTGEDRGAAQVQLEPEEHRVDAHLRRRPAVGGRVDAQHDLVRVRSRNRSSA